MIFLTPLAKKLLWVFCLILLSLSLYRVARYQYVFRMLESGEASGKHWRMADEYFFKHGQPTEKLFSLLEHPSLRICWRVSHMLRDWGYYPETVEERIVFAVASLNFDYAPLHLDEVYQRVSQREMPADFMLRNQNLNLDLRMLSARRSQTLMDLQQKHGIQIQALSFENAVFSSIYGCKGLGLGDLK